LGNQWIHHRREEHVEKDTKAATADIVKALEAFKKETK
jgi:hypothetical protein